MLIKINGGMPLKNIIKKILLKNGKPKEGENIFVGATEDGLVFCKYSKSCRSCGAKKTLDLGNIRLCEKCALLLSDKENKRLR